LKRLKPAGKAPTVPKKVRKKKRLDHFGWKGARKKKKRGSAPATRITKRYRSSRCEKEASKGKSDQMNFPQANERSENQRKGRASGGPQRKESFKINPHIDRRESTKGKNSLPKNPRGVWRIRKIVKTDEESTLGWGGKR